MRYCRFFLVMALGVLGSFGTAAWGETGAKREVAAKLVDITGVVPGIAVEMRYATAENFTGKVVYSCNRCFLAGNTAKKLGIAQAELQKRGLGLKMWDCYRPLSVQKIFWSLVPDARYVADSSKGSRHNRGASVDVTLVDVEGKELPMPTAFDDFTPRASQENNDLQVEILQNRGILVEAMKKAGFKPLATEWWHYDDADWSSYGVLDVTFDDLCRESDKGIGRDFIE